VACNHVVPADAAHEPTTTRRLLTLPRPGADQHALHCVLSTRQAADGRAFSRVDLRVVGGNGGHRAFTLYPAELRALSVALAKAATEIERLRAVGRPEHDERAP